MADYEVHVDGSAGSPVLLLAGGAATSRGFFPGLVEALPDHRVVSLDRPGTGLAAGRGVASLPSGSAAAAEVLQKLGAGPAVVIGQSLGGALAVQFAIDHPDLVAGMVLIDPTPVDLPDLVPTLRRLFAVFAFPGQLPVVGPRLDLAVWRLLSLRSQVADEARDGLEVMLRSASLHTTREALRTLQQDMRALAPRLHRLDVPAVLITAARKSDDKVRRSHERLVAALGARLIAPEGAVHAEHLRNPSLVRELVLSVVAQADAARASGS